MLHSESLAHIAPALVAAWSQIDPAIKDSVNPHFKSNYATLGSILEAIRSAFAPNQLCLVQSCEHSDDAGVTVTTTALHASGEWVACLVRIPLEKPSAIGVGSAISYGRRYGAGAVAGLWSEEDDDGTAASQYQRPLSAPKKADPPVTRVPPPPAVSRAPVTRQQELQALGEKLVEHPDLQSTETFTIEQDGAMFWAVGKGTFGAKDGLKKAGFRFDGTMKKWGTTDREAVRKARELPTFAGIAAVHAGPGLDSFEEMPDALQDDSGLPF